MKSKAFDKSKYANWIDPNKVKPYERNAKVHTEKQINNICTSIRRFGWQQDTVITSDNVLVIGHGRRLAAIKLGCEMPYHVIDKTADELTDEDIRELRIADNQTNAETGLDFSVLDEEIGDLDFDGFDFDFGLKDAGQNEWFDRTEKDGSCREEGNDKYNEFLDKFEPKKTTDDCYTPDTVYDAVASWVEKQYGLKRENFVRPFYPGGNYQAYKYGKDAVVVDNPPFSMMKQILDFYRENRIKHFLFSAAVTCFSPFSDDCCYIPLNVNVIYENGANVATSFVTNLESGFRIKTEPDLYKDIKMAVDEYRSEIHAELPKYSFPVEVATSSGIAQLSKYGVYFSVRNNECVNISTLDSMKKQGKTIFGKGYILSEKAAAEKAAAEKAAAEKAAAIRYELSEREKQIVKSLG